MIKWRGIAIRFHPLFSLLMLAAVATGYFVELLTLFAIVLVHELGHVVAAKSFGWNVIRIELLPFGGVAETDDRGGSSAFQEAAVALAGPLQNVWMALFAVLMGRLGLWDADWRDYFIQANVMIGLFNLLPILPLDGGKVMQALVSRWLPYYRSLVLCSLVSLVLAATLGLAALLGARSGGVHLNLLVIALFLCYTNWHGYRNASFRFIRFLMNREPVMERLIDKGTLAQPIVIYRHRQVGDIVRLFMRDKYHLVYILNEKGRIQAVLPEQKLLYAFFQLNAPGSAVSDVFVLE
ncbi:M50 family metallopeptidase [Paenibacillus flagellatus]|uniref:M50 family metallopeptidase n=1 Tax=Paenibacillus flagellatus TaxID=2211139 RepID=UPI001FE8891B|nr:M50 family metallopeptidase [Paenibacillus flagellatus]